MLKRNPSVIAKRLLPLYCANFFHGFVFWYAFEKVFIRGIGFNDATIGFMIAAYSAVMLVAETPSGILADRWSRKGVLMIASCALAASSLIGGLSHNVPMYICANLLWGVFFAMYSGTYDSIVYDTIYEETGDSKQFDYYGRIKTTYSSALVSSSLIGAAIAHYLTFRIGYFMTIPFSLMPIIFLAAFKEPQLHKKAVAISIGKQAKVTFSAVTRNKDVALIVLSLVMIGLLTYITLEFSQLWYIALAAPLTFYGVANAALLTSFGIGGAIAGHFKLYQFPKLMSALGLIVLSSLGLAFMRNIYVVLGCLVTLTSLLIGLNVVFSRALHDALSSNIRAGASSAISTLSRILIIPTALFIGYLSNKFSIFNSAWVVVALVLFLTMIIYVEANKSDRRSLVPKS